jgi:AcrR family transcriptional regulator
MTAERGQTNGPDEAGRTGSQEPVRPRRRHEQRTRIFDATEQLLLSHGIERIRLRDVADAAGISIGSVQHYFDTRDRLIVEYFDWSARRRLAYWTSIGPGDADPWRRVETLIERAFSEPFLHRSRIWIEFLSIAREEPFRLRLVAFQDAWRRPFREAIDDGIERGVFQPLLPVDALVDQLIMGIDGAEVAMVLGSAGMGRERLLATHLATARALLAPRF